MIVVDPPRKGCDETLLETVVKMAPERIVYVSCDPATLARDVKYLAGTGINWGKPERGHVPDDGACRDGSTAFPQKT